MLDLHALHARPTTAAAAQHPDLNKFSGEDLISAWDSVLHDYLVHPNFFALDAFDGPHFSSGKKSLRVLESSCRCSLRFQQNTKCRSWRYVADWMSFLLSMEGAAHGLRRLPEVSGRAAGERAREEWRHQMVQRLAR